MSRDELVRQYAHIIQIAHARNALSENGYAIMAAYVDAFYARFPEMRGRPLIPFAPPTPSGYVPRSKQRMGAGVSKATGNAQEKLEYGIERHEAALGRG